MSRWAIGGVSTVRNVVKVRFGRSDRRGVRGAAVSRWVNGESRIPLKAGDRRRWRRALPIRGIAQVGPGESGGVKQVFFFFCVT